MRLASAPRVTSIRPLQFGAPSVPRSGADRDRVLPRGIQDDLCHAARHIGACAAFALGPLVVDAQQRDSAPASSKGVNIGSLTCKVAGGAGSITQELPVGRLGDERQP